MKKLLKLVRIAPRLAFAFAWGAIVRAMRRMLHRPPRIWHGYGALFFTAAHVAADRRAGFPARSVVRRARLGSYELVRAAEFDVVYESDGKISDESHWLVLCDLLLRGDIWYTHFESIFFRWDQRRMNEMSFRLMRAAGIRIIVAPHGGDILHRHPHVSRYDWIGRAQLDYPEWDLTAETVAATARMDVFSRHASLILGGDSTLARLLPRHDLLFPTLVMDTDAHQPVPPASPAVPRVVHAPNHRHTKGTDFLLAAIERLKARGIECELVLVERVARHEAMTIYATADVVADQFIIGGWGVFASEAMMLGKPVMTYLDEDHLRDPVFNMPVVNTTPENVERVLAVLLLVPELRARLGAAGREAIERYHSVGAMADVWKRVYEHVWWGTPLRLGETALFSRERKPRALTEDPRDDAFWPVDVSGLMPRIHEAIRRLEA